MSFNYNRDIPDGPNNPSNDQPKMKVNTNSIDDILDVDHVSFGETPGGTHKQVTISSKNTPVAQTDPQSVVYTANGTASTIAQLLFRNQTGILPISVLRSFGVFTSVIVNGAVALDNGSNVSSITASGGGTTYTIALPANIVTGTNVAVIVASSFQGDSPAWSFAANTLTISNIVATAGKKISFFLYQI